MPEMLFDIRWPDGTEESCYSPSSVIKDYFAEESDYSVQQFVGLSETALNEASERVKNKYGYYCSSAADQLMRIKHRSEQFKPDDVIKLLRIRNH